MAEPDLILREPCIIHVQFYFCFCPSSPNPTFRNTHRSMHPAHLSVFHAILCIAAGISLSEHTSWMLPSLQCPICRPCGGLILQCDVQLHSLNMFFFSWNYLWPNHICLRLKSLLLLCLFPFRRWSSTRWMVSLYHATWYMTSSNSMWVPWTFQISTSKTESTKGAFTVHTAPFAFG